MNFFYCDENLQKAAEALDDKRLIKMILETAQLLATAINLSGGKATYKTTHQNHPVAIWTRKNRANYYITFLYFNYLCLEYWIRFNKDHKCSSYTKEFDEGQYWLEDSKIFDLPVNCTTFKEETDLVQAYRKYLNYKWANDKRSPKWTNRNPPTWAVF